MGHASGTRGVQSVARTVLEPRRNEKGAVVLLELGYSIKIKDYYRWQNHAR
jgi:hypothetical protein